MTRITEGGNVEAVFKDKERVFEIIHQRWGVTQVSGSSMAITFDNGDYVGGYMLDGRFLMSDRVSRVYREAYTFEQPEKVEPKLPFANEGNIIVGKWSGTEYKVTGVEIMSDGRFGGAQYEVKCGGRVDHEDVCCIKNQ